MIDGAPGLPDMVFPANAAVVLDRRALLGRFRPAERQGEEASFLAAFEPCRRAGSSTRSRRSAGRPVPGRRGRLHLGRARAAISGPASASAPTARPADAIGGFFGRGVVPLELASPRFYHLDTCFCPLTGGEVLYYPPAFTPAALAEIRSPGRQPTS